jgi:hypothetical protein
MMRRFNDLSLRIKLALGPTFLVLALIGLAIYALQLLDSNESSLDQLTNGALHRATLIAALDGTVSGVHARLYQLTSVAANDSDAAKAEALAAALRKDLGGIDRSFADVKATIDDHTAALATLRDQMAKTLKDYVGAAGQVIDMSANSSYALIFMNSAQEAFDIFAKQEAQLTATAKDERAALVAQIHESEGRAWVVFVAATAVAVVVAIAMTLILGNLIARPVIAMA